MLDTSELTDATDSTVWTEVCQGDANAFEIAVRRHQSAVCAVAYSICGDRSASEDITQDAFWISWQQRNALEQRDRLRPWLCGIARNLARQSSRKRVAWPSDYHVEPATWDHAPEDDAISAEEDALVWQSLETIPETYREPLILFYREQQSMAEVASALDLSVDAVKQRMSRGRAMLREQVQDLVEGTLRRSRPGVALTVAIMAGLSSGKAAWGATATAAGATFAKATTVGTMGALAGPVLGTAGGLAGAWFGTWLPAQMAATQRERQCLLRAGRKAMLVTILFTLTILLSSLAPLVLPRTTLVIAILIAVNLLNVFGFFAWTIWVSVRTSRELTRIRSETPVGVDENHTPLRRNVQAICQRWRGRVWQSRWKLFGLPLIDFQVSDPQVPTTLPDAGRAYFPRKACGWIAIGDEARGVLLAIGSKAYGGIALGGKAVGLVAIGGLAVGGIACGGMAIGGIAIGGGALGGIAFGGIANGWQAAGGMALAWDTAVGGLAIAYHAAYGGAAMAHDFAVGGAVNALHANDAAAKAVLMSHPLKVGMDWYVAHNALMTAIIVLIVLIPSLGCWPLIYRRATDAELEKDAVLDE